MDCTSITSTVLFEHICNDLGLAPAPNGTRFDPFPDGVPCESELSISDFARYALLRSVFKKSEVEASPTAETDTLSDFVAANNKCREMNESAFNYQGDDMAVGYVINGARAILDRAFFPDGDPVVTMGSIESAARFGPGRSVGLGSKLSTLYFKVGDSVQTAGSEFIRSWYEVSTAHNPVCEAAEMARQARHGRAKLCAEGNFGFQPKSFSRKRVVITEPSLNTYFQLGLGAVMEGVLQKSFNINFATQPAINAELAKQGSIDGTYATADLKQCSDYISLSLAEFFFHPSVFRWLKKLRTPVARLVVESQEDRSGGKTTTQFDLEMLSTMGNGFTFPMQTLILASLVKSTLEVLGLDGKWGVFGDDIVVPTPAFKLLCRALAACGLVVNEDKSFCSGSFRESCGSDWYRGTNVRGVYLKNYTTDQDLISCYNRLALWSARMDIPLPRTLAALLRVVSGPIPCVPPDEAVTAGIRTPLPLDEPRSDGTWDYQAYRPVPSSFTTEPWLLYEIGTGLVGKPRRFHDWVNDLRKFCDGSFNEPALLKALLAGGIRRYRMVYRNDSKPRYRLKNAKTPRWGFCVEDNFPLEGRDDDCLLRLQLLIEGSFRDYLEW